MQISLQPGHTIDPPAVAVAACTVPSDREGGASGDWHDVIALPSGETRGFLEDGDEVTLKAWCEADDAARIGFGECVGRVVAASP